MQFNVFLHDITERRRAGAALREATERFERAFEDAPIGTGMVDLTGRNVQANRAYCDMLGCSRDALLAVGVMDLTHPDDVEVSSQLPPGRGRALMEVGGSVLKGLVALREMGVRIGVTDWATAPPRLLRWSACRSTT